jgi:hypothetical protein
MAFATGTVDKKYISGFDMMDKREIFKQIVDIYNEAGFFDLFFGTSRMKKVDVPVYHHWVEDAFYIQLDTTGATITGSGTAQVSGVTLTAATSGYARKGQKVVFPNKKVGQIVSVTPAAGQDTLVIKSVDGTNLTLVAGNKLTPSTILVGEKSTAPSNLKIGWSKYFNLTEKFREVNEITDIQLVSDVEWEGNVFNRDIANKFLIFKSLINANFITGIRSATKFEDATPALTDPGNGGAEQTTMGLNQYVETYGVNDTISTPGTFALGDFDDLFTLFTAARTPKVFDAYGSDAAMRKVSTFLKGLNSSGVTSGRLMLDGKEMNFNADKFTYGLYTINFAHLPIFDHQQVLGTTDIAKSLYYVPQGKVNTKNGTADRISIRYMPQLVKGGMGNELIAEWDTGAWGRQGATSDEEVRKTHWVSHQGLEILGAQHFGKQVVLA